MALNLVVRGGADFSGIQREMARTQRAMGNFQNNISGIMKKVGFALAGIGMGVLVKDSTKMAMGVEAALQQIKRIMGESSNQFLKWADTQALAYNISKAEALKYGAVYGNLISGFTKSTGETSKYTEALLKSSAIVASATGRSMEDVMDRIRSGMLGNTESIEDLGINVNVAMIESTDAFKKFANGKSWQQINFQTQQQIRLMAILEQSSKKYGDTVNSNTNSSMQQLVAQLKNVQLSLGQAFLPILQIILPVLTALAAKLAYVMNIVAQFSQALFGKATKQAAVQAKATNQQAGAVGELGDASEKAGKQAKKAQGALAGFDEINSLADSSSSGADGSGGAGAGIDTGVGTPEIPGIDTSGVDEISAKVQEMAARVKISISNMVSFLNQNKDVIISIVGGIVGAFALIQLGGLLSQLPLLAAAIGALFTPMLLIGAGIAILIGSFIYLYRTNEDFRDSINEVWNDISKTMMSFVNDTLKPIFKYIINDFLAPIGKAFIDYVLPVLADLFVGIGKIFNDILKLLQSTIDNAWGIVKPGLDLIKNIVIDVLEIIKNLWDKYGNDLVENVRGFIQGLQETFQLIWDNIINPIIKPALEMLTWLWEKHLKGLVEEIGGFILKCVNGALELYNGFIKPMIDFIVVELGPSIANGVAFIVDVFGTMLGGISDVVKGLFKILGGIIDFIVGVFTGNWGKAWQGVKDIFKGVFDSFVGIVKVPLNIIVDSINWVIRGLNSIKIDMPSIKNPINGEVIFGGGSIGLPHINPLPKLAKGGITNGPMAAIIGDNRGGKEVVSPLSDLQDMISTAVGSAMMVSNQFNSSKSNTQGDIVLQIDGTTFARVTNPYSDKENSRIGGAMITAT